MRVVFSNVADLPVFRLWVHAPVMIRGCPDVAVHEAEVHSWAEAQTWHGGVLILPALDPKTFQLIIMAYCDDERDEILTRLRWG